MIGIVLVGAVACGGAVTPTALGPSAAATAEASIDGTALAEAMVAELVADPFVAHIDYVATATLEGVTLDMEMSGDLNGDDMRLMLKTSGADVGEAELVVLGEDVWLISAGQTTQATRSEFADMVEALCSRFRVVDDPGVLTYAGTELIDGRVLHRLEAPAGVIEYVEYGDPVITGNYDVFDAYVLADGTPVLVKGKITATDASGNEAIMTTEIRFSRIGQPMSIEEPSSGA